VRGGLDARRHADQDGLAAPRSGEQLVGQLDLLKGVEHEVGDLRVERELELGPGLVVAVHEDPPWGDPTLQREVELAAGGDIDREALLGHHPVGGGDRERLGRVDHLEVAGAGGEGLNVCPRASPDVVLGIHVGGRAVALGELDQVAAPDLEVPALVDRGAERIGLAEGGGSHTDGRL
jgi:hypothetical protein